MKTSFFFMGLALTSIAFVGCKSNNYVPVQPQQDIVFYELPCGDFDRDTKEFFTGLGTAESVNEQNARDGALEAAKGQVRRKLGGLVKGLSTDYSKFMRGSAAQTDVSSIVEGELATVVERQLNDAMKTCERMGRTAQGTYKSYVAIQISKEELAKNMASALGENEKLRMEYDRERFRKFAEEYMKGLNEQGK